MLPEKFTERMKALLNEEYDEFHKALTEQKAKKGLRVNTLKCTDEKIKESLGGKIAPLSYVKHGYVFVEESSGIGNTPEHAAGQIYIQDPGAMASAAAASSRNTLGLPVRLENSSRRLPREAATLR